MARVKQCAWFLRCTRRAETTRQHPVLGDVPICHPCDEKVERLELARAEETALMTGVNQDGEPIE